MVLILLLYIVYPQKAVYNTMQEITIMCSKGLLEIYKCTEYTSLKGNLKILYKNLKKRILNRNTLLKVDLEYKFMKCLYNSRIDYIPLDFSTEATL